MDNKKLSLHRIGAFFLSLVLLCECCNLSVFALENDDAEDITQVSVPVTQLDEESTFELVNSDIQTDDEYGAENDYMSEVAISDAEWYAEINGGSDESVSPQARVDQMVYLTQRWLNQEYGDVPGFGSVTEDGLTGWDTVYGLLRALQHELGITSLANSFGPSTSSLYQQNLLYRQDGVTDRKFAILQGALWCKGYSPGYHLYEAEDGTVVFDGVFDEGVERAVIQLKEDAGLINPNGVVTLNVMKALMSMDSFKLLSSYGGNAEIRAMQQKINRKYEQYTGLIPCDGVYGRNTNKALILALQAEEGLPVSVANGNFGNTTKLCCPTIPYVKNSTAARRYPGSSSGSYYSTTQIAAITELLQFALLVNGSSPGEIDGIFGPATQQAIRDFQEKHAINVTGMADEATWMSLFLSSGDTSRKALACDCATILTEAKAQTLYNNGYRYVGRYLTGTYNGGISKAITKEEANIIFDAGLRFFPIYQTSANYASYFTPEQGAKDAKKAIAAATALGIPKGTIIYFAVDFDALDYQVTSLIIPYFREVYRGMSESVYRTGIYGTRNTCSRVSEMGYACSSFVGDMSTGFSGNLGYSMPDNWAFDQFKTTSLGSGDGYIEIDKDGFSGRDHGVSELDGLVVPPDELPEVPNISSDTDTLTGPTLNILGNEIPLFSFDIKINTPFKDYAQGIYNADDRTYEVFVGVKADDDSTTLKTKEYAEIKQLVESFGGKTSTATWNNFQKMRSKLNKVKMDFGFEFESYYVGYVKFDLKSGTPKIIEGSLCFMAEASASIKYPVIPPAILFAKFELEGTLQGSLEWKLKESGQLSIDGPISFSLTPKLGLYFDILIEAFAGISGTLSCSIDTLEFENLSDVFKASLSADLFFEVSLWHFEYNKSKTFYELQLYPQQEYNQANLSITYDDFQLIPVHATSPANMASDDIGTIQQDMQVYCLPQIVDIGNGKMFMAYIDDSIERTAENRTILMYRVFDGESWSMPLPIHNDGTGDFKPMLYSDGNGGVHIVWQNTTEILSSGLTVEDMSEKVDLYYTHWNGESFVDTTRLTSNNTNNEMSYCLTANGEDISVVWQQNSENDALSMSGTNSIHRIQRNNGEWQNIEEIATGLYNISSIATSYFNGSNIIAYSAKTSSDYASQDDLEIFVCDGVQTLRVTDDTIPDYSVELIGGEMYWISGDTVVKATNANWEQIQPIVENLGHSIKSIDVVEGINDQKCIVWEQIGEAESVFYGVIDNGQNGFGTPIPLTSCQGYIRGWDACMLSNGKLQFSLCEAERLQTSSGGKPYGRIDLTHIEANEYFDISINPIVTYDNDITPGTDITIFAEISNTGSIPVEQFEIAFIDEDGAIIQSSTMQQELQVGESVDVEIPFSLPEALSRSEYSLVINPMGEEDLTPQNNTAIFTIGFADLLIENAEDYRDEDGRYIKVVVTNTGFENVSQANIALHKGGRAGIILSERELVDIEVGTSLEILFEIDDSNLDATISEDPDTYYLMLTTQTEESNYGNNSIEYLLYPDYLLNLSAELGGTVTGIGEYEKGASVLITATPNEGFIFDGWYEKGRLLHGVPQETQVVIEGNRTLVAKFKPNDLQIVELEVFGSPAVNETLTFTGTAEGGVQPLMWQFEIYNESNNEMPIFENTSSINFFEWCPTEEGVFIIAVTVTDASGFEATYTTQVIVE